jgi:arabinosaccharide transport system substrate-binding protein
MRTLSERFSAGSLVICLLAVVSSLAVAMLDEPPRAPLEMWLFARPHRDAYRPIVARWNARRAERAELYVLGIPAMERRMLSGFLSDTPVADLLEPDVNVASRAFAGPVEDVGFVDLTGRLRDEGILEAMNEPSFSPWTFRGRVFGIPHDVHPVLLCYRADLVERAGIDVSQIETWDDFIRVCRPLMADEDGDGRPDRYLLNLWEQQLDVIEALLLQAGGANFDEQNRPVLQSEVNVRVVSTLASWITDGPHRIAVDAEEFSESGNRLRVEGKVVASLMPDWLTGVYQGDLPQLAGKLKLMPLPSWTPGGRRTSVWGGSMLGISRRSRSIDAAWEFAKEIYLSDASARRLFETNGIISPFKRLWSEDFYDAPNAYFSGQPIGRLYIDYAPGIPRRTSSPHNKFAKECFRSAISGVKEFAQRNKVYAPHELADEARRQLGLAQEAVVQRIERNVFAREEVLAERTP